MDFVFARTAALERWLNGCRRLKAAVVVYRSSGRLSNKNPECAFTVSRVHARGAGRGHGHGRSFALHLLAHGLVPSACEFELQALLHVTVDAERPVALSDGLDLCAVHHGAGFRDHPVAPREDEVGCPAAAC